MTKLSLDGVTLGTYAAGNWPTDLLFDGENIWVAKHGSAPTLTKLALDGKTLLKCEYDGWGMYGTQSGLEGLAFDGKCIWVITRFRCA